MRHLCCVLSTARGDRTSADRNGLQSDRQRPRKPNGFRHETPVRAVVALSNSGEVVINHGLPAVWPTGPDRRHGWRGPSLES
jgi:hypothetical protein